jgi:hypothetical protein
MLIPILHPSGSAWDAVPWAARRSLVFSQSAVLAGIAVSLIIVVVILLTLSG